ncbi:accessory gland protein Acp29AB-like [Drosophila tropicalis]|uniref:accessory gland protein Acp29AB-like n=1 Tax=Drosophila tropicalis TaxID=46794 RepID=UPI0035AB7B44
MYFLYILLFLVNILFVLRAENCMLDEAQNECDKYCFSSVKPFLSYLPSMLKRLEACETLNPNHAYGRLDKIDNQLTQQLELIVRKIDALEIFKPSYCDKRIDKMENLSETVSELKKEVEMLRTNDINIKATVEDLKYQFSLLQRPNFQKIGLKYYYIESSKDLTWLQALQRCSKWGGHLASLQSETEWNNVKPKLKGKNYWIDINDIEKEGTYMSATNNEPAKYLQWKVAEPSNKNPYTDRDENCVELREDFSYQMNDLSCDNKISFICESDTELFTN